MAQMIRQHKQLQKSMSSRINSIKASPTRARSLGIEESRTKTKTVLRFQISWPEINNKFKECHRKSSNLPKSKRSTLEQGLKTSLSTTTKE